MNIKLLSISLFLFLTVQTFAQDTLPYWYNNAIPLKDQPDAVKEYTYDYNTQEEALAYNHTFLYNSEGKVTQHIRSNQGISNVYQTYKFLFTYDSEGRLDHYYHQQLGFNGYDTQREEQWIYDAHGMITNRNIWSVSGGTKYIGSPSYKREITRDGSGNVQNINVYKYSTFAEDFVIDEVFEFVYNASEELDTINYSQANATWGGRMDLREKRYDFDFYEKNYTNTDLMKFNSYTYQNVISGNILNVTESRDAQGRLTESRTEYENGGNFLHKVYTYEADQNTVIENSIAKTVTYIDQSGLPYKTEVFYNNTIDGWVLETPAYTQKIRTFENNRIATELVENLLEEEYKKSTKFVFEYSITGLNPASEWNIRTEIYPNPNKGNFSISNWDKIEKINLVALDGTTKEIPVAEMILLQENPGCYMLMVYYQDGKTGNVKVVVE